MEELGFKSVGELLQHVPGVSVAMAPQSTLLVAYLREKDGEEEKEEDEEKKAEEEEIKQEVKEKPVCVLLLCRRLFCSVTHFS